jgi:hypothetical protein
MYNKIVSGYQPRQMVEWRKYQRFEDRLRPHPQGTEVGDLMATLDWRYAF